MGMFTPLAVNTNDPENKKYADTEPLLTIDGKTYDCRTNFSASEGMTYTDMLLNAGENAAVEWLLQLALGSEGYQAFRAYQCFTTDQVSAVVSQVLERAMIGFKGEPDPKAVQPPSASPTA